MAPPAGLEAPAPRLAQPMIGLLEVTSALEPSTSAEEYLRGSLPCVSGLALLDSVDGYQRVVSRCTDFTRAAATGVRRLRRGPSGQGQEHDRH